MIGFDSALEFFVELFCRHTRYRRIALLMEPHSTLFGEFDRRDLDTGAELDLIGFHPARYGMSEADIVEAYPDLKADDVREAMRFVADDSAS